MAIDKEVVNELYIVKGKATDLEVANQTTVDLTSKFITVRSADNAIIPSIKIKNVGGGSAQTRLSMEPWELRPAGESFSLSCVDRNYSSDVILRFAAFGNGGNDVATQRAVWNYTGLMLGNGNLPSSALELAPNTTADLSQATLKVDRIKYSGIPNDMKWFRHEFVIPDAGTEHSFDLIPVLTAQGLPNTLDKLVHVSYCVKSNTDSSINFKEYSDSKPQLYKIQRPDSSNATLTFWHSGNNNSYKAVFLFGWQF